MHMDYGLKIELKSTIKVAKLASYSTIRAALMVHQGICIRSATSDIHIIFLSKSAKQNEAMNGSDDFKLSIVNFPMIPVVPLNTIIGAATVNKLRLAGKRMEGGASFNSTHELYNKMMVLHFIVCNIC